ncbi:PilW family protein [Deefgea sp. CFH1-16]|uniref:PilW family protein n=1 Tax=Deefgea sp. CFH1-16 TaxID=2675457 RepID=UPI0015F39D01|nr:PilW family protein [Deefgea sp. CFH1-16]MBM5574229.1 hypothetical protein [Deefgea sp. CFH1-16]
MFKQYGISLIELMIAMAISLVALLALTTLYSNTRQTSNLQRIQNQLSEDGRFAISMLQRVVSQAGYRPDPRVTLQLGPSPTPGRIIAMSSEAIGVIFTPDGESQIACDGGLAPTPTPVFPNPTPTPRTLVIAKVNNILRCAPDPLATPNPCPDCADWIAPSSGTSTELVDFQIQYGIDDAIATPNPSASPPSSSLAPEFRCDTSKPIDCVADRYVPPAPAPSPAPTPVPVPSPSPIPSPIALLTNVSAAQIVSVKVCLILRSEKTDSSIEKAENIKNCNGAEFTGTKDDHHLYRMFRTTIRVKNN